MTSQEEIDRKLSLLYRIQGLSSPNSTLEELIRSNKLDELQNQIDSRLENIREMLNNSPAQTSSRLFDYLKEDKYLSEQTYILPPELTDTNPKVPEWAEVHSRILKDITSGKTIDKFMFGGLLLYGTAVGTGKTEYPMFLANLAKEKTKFVFVNISEIRGDPKPGTVLRNLYRQLEDLAIKEGVIYAAVFDEFDKLVNKYSVHHSSIKEEHSDSSDSKRQNSQSRRETKETLQVDEIGEELFSTLKNIISGTEDIKHVFTIATSNQSAYPEALLRRLQPVEVLPLGMPQFYFSNDLIPDYSNYNKTLPRIINILNATHYREHGESNQNLMKIGQELNVLLKKINDEHGSYDKKKKDVLFGGEGDIITAKRNNAYLSNILDYFGCNITKARETKGYDSRTTTYSILKFAGEMEVDGNIHRKHVFFGSKETSPEVELMQSITPDKIAKVYKSNPKNFESYNSAKKELGQLIFPQLREYAEYLKKGKIKE